MERIRRKDGSEIRITVSEFKGFTYIHFRLFTEGKDGRHYPTKTGMTIRPNEWEDFKTAVNNMDITKIDGGEEIV